MSRHVLRPITCPQCSKESDFLVWDSINTTLDPEMYQAVRDGSAFLFKCPHCDCEVSVDYGFLYHQMDDSIMIQYCNSDENFEEMLQMFTKKPNPESDVDEMVHNLLDDNYLIRIVRTRNQLLEKLAIFDAGLDDRIIEIIKLFYMVQLLEQNENEHVDELLMFTDSTGKHILKFLSEGMRFATAEITDEIYTDIQEKYGNNLPDLRKDDVVIDQDWALAHIKAHMR